ncbi:universal stress protein [Nocardia abscessus]|uniref:universal stress protein n=1 Tax=Nocardia abscessus TaxID=120957 RepID=UPI003CC801EE
MSPNPFHDPRHIRELRQQCSDKFPDVCVDRVVIEGRPARRLLEASRHAQLVVLGSRGRGGVAGATLGSVSQAVPQASRIPVLVAPCRQ